MTALDLFGMEHADRRSIGSHESAVGGSDEWLTPPNIIDALGAFDLDPCSPGDRRTRNPAATGRIRSLDGRFGMTAHVYAVRYPDSLVRDSSWRCVADVIASYAGGYYTDERGQVTGTLVRAVVGTDVWVEV